VRLARTDQHPLQNSPDGNIGFGWVKPEHELELPVLSPRVADCNQRTRDMGSGGVTLYSPVQDVHLKCQNRKLEKQPEATTRQEAQHVCEVHCMPRIPWESLHLRETLAGSIGYFSVSDPGKMLFRSSRTCGFYTIEKGAIVKFAEMPCSQIQWQSNPNLLSPFSDR